MRREGRPKNRPPHFASRVSYSAGAAKIRLIRTFAASAVQNPEFNTPKIAKRLVRNNHAKKCCIFSLKCLDVNKLIHNFVTQVKIGCTLAKPIFAPKAKIGYTSAELTSKLQALLSVCTIFAPMVKIGCTLAKPILTPKLQQKDGEQTASPPLREPIKTPNNEILCSHNALHALPFSKASFRVC